MRQVAEREEEEFYEHRIPDEWREALHPPGTDWVGEHMTGAPYVIVGPGQSYALIPDAEGGVRQVKHYYMLESPGIAVGFLLSSASVASIAPSLITSGTSSVGPRGGNRASRRCSRVRFSTGVIRSAIPSGSPRLRLGLR